MCLLPLQMSLTDQDSLSLGSAMWEVITHEQQAEIFSWLASEGIYVLLGEGGFRSLPSGSLRSLPEEDPPLLRDRLRNGVILCELLLLLEPGASEHTRLAQSIAYSPLNLQQARRNVVSALWLLRLRRCPPIPRQYLLQAEPILKGDKTVLWGLLREIMRSSSQALPTDPGLLSPGR